MIEAMHHQIFEVVERSLEHAPSQRTNDFAELFGSAAADTQPNPIKQLPGSQPDPGLPNPAQPNPIKQLPGSQTDPGQPNVAAWLTSYYAQQQKANPAWGSAGPTASTSFQPAAGAGESTLDMGLYGPDAIYSQALANQIGNSFASMTGADPASCTAQLPGIPNQQNQAAFDSSLAYTNAQRLESGQPIDTAAYWSDPGSLTINGHTYTSKQLGYAGPGQSSGPEPIYISESNQIAGTKTFSVPGYTGTVTGVQAGRFYTLQQLEQAGLPSGQADAQFEPGSWSQKQAG